MRVPEERRSVPAAFLASFTTNFSDSKCQMAVAVLHRCQNTSIHRRDAEYERERVQRAPHTPIAVRPRFSMIEFTPQGLSTASSFIPRPARHPRGTRGPLRPPNLERIGGLYLYAPRSTALGSRRRGARARADDFAKIAKCAIFARGQGTAELKCRRGQSSALLATDSLFLILVQR